MLTKPKIATILTIGAELLKGSTLNTNARFLGQRLLSAGFRVRSQISCDDVEGEIHACLKETLQESDLVIVSGGLGPTPDDVTRDAIAGYFKVPLKFSRQQGTRILNVYRKLGRVMPESVRKEALYPANASALINRYGIALGFSIKQRGRLLVALPGVPRELEKLFDEKVISLIRRTFPTARPKYELTVKTLGLSEPAVMEKLGSDFFDEPFEFGIYPHPGEVTLRLFTEQAAILRKLRRKVLRRLAGSIYATNEGTLAGRLGEMLMARKETLAAAESCTGGQLSAELTAAAGASRYFLGGLVAYANKIKFKLGVSKSDLRRYGAVSQSVALQLASGICKKFGADWGIGITGIAGPGGEGLKKPLGLVYIALQGPSQKIGDRSKNGSVPKNALVEKCLFWGSRDQIQRRAVAKALELLWRKISIES